jgi:hypothetical protein
VSDKLLVALAIRACNVATDNVHGFGRVSFRHYVDGVLTFAPISDPDQPSEQHNTPPTPADDMNHAIAEPPARKTHQ